MRIHAVHDYAVVSSRQPLALKVSFEKNVIGRVAVALGACVLQHAVGYINSQHFAACAHALQQLRHKHTRASAKVEHVHALVNIYYVEYAANNGVC